MDTNLRMTANNHLHLEESTLLTAQPHFLFFESYFISFSFFSLPKWENVLLSFQIPSVTIYSRLHHLGSVQPHSQLDASTYSPADFTQICPAAARMLGRIVCQKHLIGTMWPVEHQENSGEKGTVIEWSGNLKCFNSLNRNTNNAGVCWGVFPVLHRQAFMHY